jgi:hypothetical protein
MDVCLLKKIQVGISAIEVALDARPVIVKVKKKYRSKMSGTTGNAFVVA